MNKAPKRQRTLAYVSAATCVAAALVFTYRFLTRPPTIEQAAADLARAQYSGDAAALADAVPQYELDKLGWSRDKAKTFIREVILPKLKGIKIRSFGRVFAQSAGSSGVALYTVVGPSGEELPGGLAIVERSDDKPFRLMKFALIDGWCTEYQLKFHRKPLNSLSLLAIIWGLEKDRRTLLKYGFTGFAQDDEKAPLRSLDEASRRAHMMLDSMTAPRDTADEK